MKFLAFETRGARIDGRRIRAPIFEHRSGLPVSAACVVANGFRETLSRSFAGPVSIRLFEPMLPGPDGWCAVTRDARVYGVRGSQADAAIVIRARDAAALAATAFGESSRDVRELSTVEREVLDRLVAGLASNLAVLCGNPEAPQPLERLVGFSTYFEMQMESPMRASIGVALAREPASETVPGLGLADVDDVRVDVTVRCGEVDVEAGTVATLEIGSVLPFGRGCGAGTALLAGRVIARGECGVVGGRYALSIGTSLKAEGSTEPAS